MSQKQLSRKARALRIGLAVVGTIVALPPAANGLAALAELGLYGSLYQNGRPTAIYENSDQPGFARLKANSSAPGLLHSVSINSLGLRGAELENPKPDNGLRVWAVGGSTTYDVFASEDDTTWPAQLQELLQDAAPDRSVEVINGGAPGEVIAGSRDLFESMASTVKPDVLVFYHGTNDIRHQLNQSSLQQPQGNVGPDGVCDQDILPPFDIALFRWRERLIPPVTEILDHWKGRSLGSGQLSAIQREVEAQLRSAQAFGVQVVMANHAIQAPLATPEQDDLDELLDYAQHLQIPPAQVIEAFDDYNQMLGQLASQYAIPLADVRNAVGDDPDHWGDATHFSNSGSLKAAEAIAETMVAANLHQAQGTQTQRQSGPPRRQNAGPPPMQTRPPPPGPPR